MKPNVIRDKAGLTHRSPIQESATAYFDSQAAYSIIDAASNASSRGETVREKQKATSTSKVALRPAGSCTTAPDWITREGIKTPVAGGFGNR
ncbi:hypothetical protein [Cupriavidus taiwanensis]|uniref:hypothetical protein n=1 Tax=Cupriavidus taiwanensis TaxID=164546 RepID=UPI0039C020B9